jgi:hypothetical protein
LETALISEVMRAVTLGPGLVTVRVMTALVADWRAVAMAWKLVLMVATSVTWRAASVLALMAATALSAE